MTRVMVAMAARNHRDLSPPQSISRLYEATVTNFIQFLIVLCFVARPNSFLVAVSGD